MPNKVDHLILICNEYESEKKIFDFSNTFHGEGLHKASYHAVFPNLGITSTMVKSEGSWQDKSGQIIFKLVNMLIFSFPGLFNYHGVEYFLTS